VISSIFLQVVAGLGVDRVLEGRVGDSGFLGFHDFSSIYGGENAHDRQGNSFFS